MNWVEELCRIYDEYQASNPDMAVIFHMPAQAHAEITLSEDGCFISARKIENKSDGEMIIPTTEQSGARTSGVSPHPYADKLFYLAGDLSRYTTGKKADKKYFEAYQDQLKEWAGSKFVHPAVTALYQYISKETLTKDLIDAEVLEVDEKGMLKEKVKIGNTSQTDIFFRFRIQYHNESMEEKTWEDQTLQECYIRKCQAEQQSSPDKMFCYATGQYTTCTYNHPKGITKVNNQAKLISANDQDGFTFRGRFDNKEEAFAVGYECSQKLHNALKWLVDKYAITVDSTHILIWESEMEEIPTIFNPVLKEEENEVPDTFISYKNMIKRSLLGDMNPEEKEQISYPDENVVIMILDACAPGRISLSSFETLSLSDYLEHLIDWHTKTACQRYSYRNGQLNYRSVSLFELIDYVYGTEQGGKLVCAPEVRKQTILRLMPCIMYGKSVPKDIIQRLCNRCKRPMSFSKKENWEQTLEIACGILKREKLRKEKQEDYELGLDLDCTNRDYLYGRLLAVAEIAERVTYNREDKQKRVTNARRYFERFTDRPYETWEWLYKRLMPYFNKMPAAQRSFYEGLIGEITTKFDPADYRNNSRLSADYLLAYYCQAQKIRELTKKNNEEIVEE